MSQSRWSGLKQCINATFQTRPARILYSAGSGFSVAASITYVGTVISSCFPPALTCCLAGSACVTTSALQYQQLSSENDRINELEITNAANAKRIQELEDSIKKMTLDNQELLVAAEVQFNVLDRIIPTLADESVRDACRKALAPPQEKMDILTLRPTNTTSLRVTSEHQESKLNPHSLFGDSMLIPKAFLSSAISDAQDSDDDEITSEQLLTQEFDDFDAYPDDRNKKKTPLTEGTPLRPLKNNIRYV